MHAALVTATGIPANKCANTRHLVDCATRQLIVYAGIRGGGISISRQINRLINRLINTSVTVGFQPHVHTWDKQLINLEQSIDS